jgi:hypothetical protein
MTPKEKAIELFNLFKKPAKVNLKGKTTNQIIEEIHETFYTEVDRLLADAKILNSIETDKGELILKQEKLKSLGFRSTQEVVEAQKEKDRLSSLESENNSKNTLTEAINYFSFKYPFYKFITEESVKKICEKYNLVYSEVGRYIGTVPDANIEQMQNFKIQDTDECYKHSISRGFRERDFSHSYKSLEDYEKYKKERHTESYRLREYGENYSKCPLEICAQIKDFNTDNMEVKTFKLSKIEIPDSVVLQPVFFKGKKHYLIVTAWGITNNYKK